MVKRYGTAAGPGCLGARLQSSLSWTHKSLPQATCEGLDGRCLIPDQGQGPQVRMCPQLSQKNRTERRTQMWYAVPLSPWTQPALDWQPGCRHA